MTTLSNENVNKPRSKRNNKLHNILRNLILSSLSTTISTSNSTTNDLTPEQQLINEINKRKVHENICTNYDKAIIYIPKQGERDIHKIAKILKQMTSFKKFIHFNRIDDASLHLIANYVDIKQYDKDTIIFNQGDKADNFYCIISGKVSIRKESENEQHEIIQLQCGDYFGDWGLLDNAKRTASACVTEKCVLMVMGPKQFQNSIYKCMKKEEVIRRSFIKKTVIPLQHVYNFNEFYKMMTRVIVPKNKLIYEEGMNAECIYLIYDGYGKIIKKEISNYNAVLLVEKGDFVGLESIMNVKMNNDDECDNNVNNEMIYKYKNSLYSAGEFNVFFKINVNWLNVMKTKEVIKFLKELYMKNKNVVNELVGKNVSVQKGKRLHYRENIIKDIINGGGCNNVANKIDFNKIRSVSLKEKRIVQKMKPDILRLNKNVHKEKGMKKERKGNENQQKVNKGGDTTTNNNKHITTLSSCTFITDYFNNNKHNKHHHNHHQCIQSSDLCSTDPTSTFINTLPSCYNSIIPNDNNNTNTSNLDTIINNTTHTLLHPINNNYRTHRNKHSKKRRLILLNNFIIKAAYNYIPQTASPSSSLSPQHHRCQTFHKPKYISGHISLPFISDIISSK